MAKITSRGGIRGKEKGGRRKARRVQERITSRGFLEVWPL
jgi:hypothetical protein